MKLGNGTLVDHLDDRPRYEYDRIHYDIRMTLSPPKQIKTYVRLE